MFDAPGIPLYVLVLMLIVVPGGLAVLLGMAGSRGEKPLIFRCRRCGGVFRERPHRPFPTVCSLCESSDWNAAP